jgi:signal transduction histidine kinase
MTDDSKLELDSEIGVLVCDDNAEIRSILTEIIVLEPGLRFAGHACDGNDAVAKATLLQPDLIILDLAMPNRSGLDALPELAVVAPHAKTIVLSAYSAASMVEEAMKRGAVSYVEKGNQMVDELLAAMHAAFEAHVPAEPALDDVVFLTERYQLGTANVPEAGANGSVDDLRARAESSRRQALRLEVIGRATAGVAHDFDNLLAAVRGFAQLGQRSTADEKTHRYFAEIESAGRKAGELTRQLTAFAGPHDLAPTTVDLNEIVEGLSSLLQQLLPGDIELCFALSAQPVPVFVDRGQLEQVLVNLIVNGQDAIAGIGTITISTTAVDPVRREQHALVTPAGWLQVSDTGSGIPAEVMPHIFEPFFSTKPPEAGSGLGLATAHGIVSESGGDILVDTSPAGTTMTIALPASAAR